MTDDRSDNSIISVRIQILDTNDPPIALFKDDVFYLNENSPGGVTVGTLTATDPDKNQVLSFAMNAGTKPIPFEIDSNTGEILVIDTLDFETTSEYRISATVSDSTLGPSYGKSDIGYFSIRLIDVNEPPTIVANQIRTIAENSPRGAPVGDHMSALDSDLGGSLSYLIVSGNEMGLFAMRSCDGQISVQNSQLLDYEALSPTTTIALVVRVSDGQFFDQKIVSVEITDQPESPAFNEKGYFFSVAENAVAATIVGTVQATHPDDGSTISYSLIDRVSGGLFSLDSTTGVLRTSKSSTGTVLDHETSQVFSLKVIATDAAQMTDTVQLTVRVGDVNEAPIVEDNLKYYISEDRDNSKLLWWSRFANPFLNGFDVDEGQKVSFSIVPEEGGDIFQTTAKGNRLYVKSGIQLDYEQVKQYTIGIMVSDDASPKLTTVVHATVIVLDVNEKPILLPARAVLAENSARGTKVGSPMVASDPDTSVLLQPYYGEWSKLSSRGKTYGISDVGKDSFDNKFAASPTNILRRVCTKCGAQHQDIYYKRITSFSTGSSRSIYDLLHTTWSSAGNMLNKDFSLFSSYKDAIADQNAWSFCNYDDTGIGFPRDCGPNRWINSQWQSATR